MSFYDRDVSFVVLVTIVNNQDMSFETLVNVTLGMSFYFLVFVITSKFNGSFLILTS